MESYTISSEKLTVKIRSKGAELDSVYSNETKLEYLWNGDPAFWAKKSPVLFPIVGTLKNNTYYFNNKSYSLTRHGFARDMEFKMTAQSDSSLTMTLASSEATLKGYPFSFTLNIIYTVRENELEVKYHVLNGGQDNMYFSIGGHPAFRLPLEHGIAYEDYFFEFSQTEDARRWMISREGLIEAVAIPFLMNDTRLPLSRDLFKKDAVVLKYLNSESVRLKSAKSPHGIEFHFPRFPYLGLWAAPDANFVCIEPWCGIADNTTTDQQLINKEGINLLTPEQSFERKWWVSFY